MESQVAKHKKSTKGWTCSSLITWRLQGVTSQEETNSFSHIPAGGERSVWEGRHYCCSCPNGAGWIPMIQCVLAGVVNNERVICFLHSQRDKDLIREELFTLVGDPKLRLDRLQLTFWLPGFLYQIWKDSGISGLEKLLVSIQQQAGEHGYRCVRIIGYASSYAHIEASVEIWAKLEMDLTTIWERNCTNRAIPVTTFCLYDESDLSEEVKNSHVVLL